ncbi:hypothetical protein Tco_0013776 [Tanacetum coccineum]
MRFSMSIRQVAHRGRHPSIRVGVRSNYPRIPLTKFFVFVLKYFRIHISQLSPFGAARISHFEVLTRVLDLGRLPPDSIKNWADHFFWVDSRVFPISVPLYTGGVLEKDQAPHLTARQEQAVQVLSSNKAPFRRTADPQKVQAVEVQKGEEQVTLFDSIKHCFISLDAPAAGHQASSSCSGAGAKVSVSFAAGNVVEENVIPEGSFLDLTDPECDVTVVEKNVAQKQPEKSKRKKLLKRSDPLPAKRLDVILINLNCLSVRFNVGVARQICLGSEVRSRAEHKLELKEKLRGKYDAWGGGGRGVLLREKDAEIARLKSLVEENGEKEGRSSAEVLRLRDQILLDISLLDSRASYLKSALDDSQAACGGVCTLHSAFSLILKRSGKAQQKSKLRSCTISPVVPGILGHALGRAVDYGMQEGLAAGHEHGIAGTPLSAVVAYNPETAKNNYLDAVRALEEVDFPLVHLLKSKKDSGMDEVLDCFLLDGPLANLPEAAHLQPCLEQLSVPIYHADVNVVAGETSLSFALLNVHTRAEGAKKHAAALRQLMVDIVSHPLSSQNLLGQASTSAVISCVEDLDTDEDLGSVVCMPQFEDPRFEILP